MYPRSRAALVVKQTEYALQAQQARRVPVSSFEGFLEEQRARIARVTAASVQRCREKLGIWQEQRYDRRNDGGDVVMEIRGCVGSDAHVGE